MNLQRVVTSVERSHFCCLKILIPSFKSFSENGRLQSPSAENQSCVMVFDLRAWLLTAAYVSLCLCLSSSNGRPRPRLLTIKTPPALATRRFGCVLFAAACKVWQADGITYQCVFVPLAADLMHHMRLIHLRVFLAKQDVSQYFNHVNVLH